MSADAAALAHATSLRERGFTVFERAYDPAWVAALRGELTALYDGLGRPPLHDPGHRELGPGIQLCAAGLAVHSLLAQRPEYAATLLQPAIVAAIREVLGDMLLEVAGCVISDRARPFFAWHTHVGGVDDGVHRRRGAWPEVAGAERVMCLLYLQDVDDDAGPMLVLPRAAGDPVAPPYDHALASWPGEVVLRPPAGSVIALEQCTWHAIRRMQGPGLRMFVGTTFAARTTAPAAFVDPDLARWTGASPLLASVLA
ncbi:MAG: phytanoyl-CoA dioxygenase family protein [Nannocystaceae bacterium]